MLTRRRAQAAQREQPPALIDALPDSTLVDIFMYLKPKELVGAAQVCTRWRGLCESQRLWRHRRWSRLWLRDAQNPNEELLGVVRMLRRARGVAEFQEVRVAIRSGLRIHYDYKERRASFDVAADGRMVLNLNVEFTSWSRWPRTTISPSLLLTLCVQELVKRGVDALSVDVSEDDNCRTDSRDHRFLTACEALALWDCIASKTWLKRLELKVDNNSPLLSTPFLWPRPASRLRSLSLHVVYDKVGDSQSPNALRSLFSSYRTQVKDLSILSERYQPLLADCRSDLASLGGWLLPSLLDALRRQTCLRGLRLAIGDYESPVPAERSLRVLADALDLPNVHLHVSDLRITLSADDYTVDDEAFTLADELAVLSGVARCRGLTRLSLVPLAAFRDEASGTAALRALLCGLPSLRLLELQDAPCGLPLQAMLDGDPARPANSLRELAMLGLCRYKDLGDWPGALRRLLVECPSLHVRLGEEEEYHYACLGPGRQHDEIEIPSATVILPHATKAQCKDCPASAVRWGKSRQAVYFEEFLTKTEREQRQLPPGPLRFRY